jgi:hypothetical protein
MKRLFYITIFLMSGIWFTACRGIQYVPVETIRTEYKTRDSIRFDSIYQRDSIYMLIKGDTVYQYKYKYLYRYLIINKTDTIIQVDSVQVPIEVEKKLTKWQAMKIELGGWAFGILIAFVLMIAGWFVYKKRKRTAE